MLAIPAVLLSVGMLYVPESPRWLAMRKKSHRAQAVPERLRHSPKQARKERNGIVKLAKSERGQVSVLSKTESVHKRLLAFTRIRQHR